MTACIAVVASEKGVVVGRLTFTEDGDPIDCSRMGVGGKAIPPNVDKVLLTVSCGGRHVGPFGCAYYQVSSQYTAL